MALNLPILIVGPLRRWTLVGRLDMLTVIASCRCVVQCSSTRSFKSNRLVVFVVVAFIAAVSAYCTYFSYCLLATLIGAVCGAFLYAVARPYAYVRTFGCVGDMRVHVACALCILSYVRKFAWRSW